MNGEQRSEAIAATLAAMQRTRFELRTEMVPPERDADGEHGSAAMRPLKTWLRYAKQKLRRSNLWFQVAPLYDAAAPLIRRHPLPALAVAGVVGALLVSARPWRWALLSTPLLLMQRQVSAWLMAQMTGAAGRAMMGMFGTGPAASRQRRRTASPPSESERAPPA